jgi:hypothetical protein
MSLSFSLSTICQSKHGFLPVTATAVFLALAPRPLNTYRIGSILVKASKGLRQVNVNTVYVTGISIFNNFASLNMALYQ